MPILFSRTLNVPHSRWNKRPPTKGAPSSWAWQVLTGSGDVPSAMDSAVRGAGSWDDPWPQWHCSLHARLLSLLGGGGPFHICALSRVSPVGDTERVSLSEKGPVPTFGPRPRATKSASRSSPTARDQMARSDGAVQGGRTEDGPWFPDGPLARSGELPGPQRGRADPGLGAP